MNPKFARNNHCHTTVKLADKSLVGVGQNIMEEEIWKDIKGFENRYQISSFGNVKSLSKRKGWGKGYMTKEHLMKPKISNNKYLQIGLRGINNKKWFLIHKLVIETFIGIRPKGMYIDHKDGIKHNNNVFNLEYVSPSENRMRAISMGLIINPRGEGNIKAKLTEEKVLEMRRLFSSGGYTKAELGRMFGVSDGMACDIINKKFWKHLLK